MSALSEFKQQYATALHDYLKGNGEAALKSAYELGRRAVTDGIGVLELTGLHEQTMVQQFRAECAQTAERGARFLLESLSPFEMTQRGFRDANTALQDLNRTLEQRVAERTADVEAARAQAEEANRAKSDFMAVISHELRTPLNAVLGYADLMEAGISGPLTEKQQNYVGAIKTSASHLLELIEEILTFAKVETGREEVNLELVDLGPLMEEAAALTEPAAARQGIEFQVVLPSPDTRIRSDSRKLRQILVNLLSNAVKFTERGSVTLSATVEGEWATLQVKDTGIGIPAEHLEHIFDAFWQVERSTTRRTGGTGLGLSVSRTLARKLGGDVTVSSTHHAGSTFTVRLPTNPPA